MSAKDYVFRWQVQVPEVLKNGSVFDRWEEDFTSYVESNALLRVDEFGFYLVYMVEGKEPKLLEHLEQKGDRDSLVQRSITIVYGPDYVNLSFIRLVAQDVATADAWLTGMRHVTHQFRVAHVCPMTCLMKHWTMLTLQLNERRKISVRHLTRTFSSGRDQKHILNLLTEMNLCANRMDADIEPSQFTFDRFYEVYIRMLGRTEVTQDLFRVLCDDASGGTDYLTVQQLMDFLNDKQRDPGLNEILFPAYDRPRVLQLISKYEKNEEFVKNERLSQDAFLRYLMSDENAPVFLDRIELYHNMDQPLAHYYINSSHNTYLTGRQFGGKSSVEMYRQVLLSGCRCIELDCWDGQGADKGEPIITHGKAMCTDIHFKDAIIAIAETAFVVSDFPVCLSFENHCSKANQLKMAKYCVEYFGDLLLTKPLEGHPLEPGVSLPSPNLLKRKILIKNKRLKPDAERAQLEQYLKEGRVDDDVAGENAHIVVGEDGALVDDDGDSSESQQVTVVTVGGDAVHLECPVVDEAHPELTGSIKEDAHPELKPVGSTGDVLKSKIKAMAIGKLTNKDNVALALLSPDDVQQLVETYNYTGATINIHCYLSSLVNYTHPIKFIGFDVAEQTNCHFHMSSFPENAGLGYLKQNAIELVNYNKRQLSRIYPKGGRVDSSNYLPQIFWNAGCQMVSLNFQTSDLAMQLNQGKFEYNRQCGYLLKPDFMRRDDRTFDPFSESPVDGVIAAYCSVQVISGQFLCERKVGTYVEVEMYGLPTDMIRKEFRTRIIPQNGLNPVYTTKPEEKFEFRKVVLPELAVLRFAVYEESGRLLGQRILPLDGLQAGYRHISLRTESNFPMTLPTLFCHVVLKTYVPDGLANLVNALADPRGWLKEEKKQSEEQRQKQLEALGYPKEDIEDVPTKKANQSTANSVPSTPRPLPGGHQGSLVGNTAQNVQSARGDEREHVPIEPITSENLKKEKDFLKLLKKHLKDVEELKKRHTKERTAIQKSQCTFMEKIVTDQDRRRSSVDRKLFLVKKSSTTNSSPVGEDQITVPSFVNERVKEVVGKQTKEWSDMVCRQQSEEYTLAKAQCREQWDLLRKLLEQAQQAQLAELKARHSMGGKELRETQAKNSMENAKKIHTDKSIKTRAEKDRRIKENRAKNLKLFVDERTRLEMRHKNQEESLKRVHIEQKEMLEKEAKKALELQDQIHQEAVLALTTAAVV